MSQADVVPVVPLFGFCGAAIFFEEVVCTNLVWPRRERVLGLTGNSVGVEEGGRSHLRT